MQGIFIFIWKAKSKNIILSMILNLTVTYDKNLFL